MPAVARTGDATSTGHACDTVTTVVGVTGASAMVFANGIPIACAGDIIAPHTILVGIVCVPHVAKINIGSASVFVGGKAVGRVGDWTDDFGAITAGSPDVNAGGPALPVPEPEPPEE